ncbi:chromatin remodelling complex Rsc7/Swp82 subunit-domain-containing protein [Clohesyomyces aquaticus]|uniref:Chromatin remodelling complex Rsc7/Swp82 subunit-domain-containing protein n=1 Tax=Clohesyomyces aquaticus TaxID=1231657 RepID=A0A1Y1Y6H5_9PLEO|nr:chromatin remodelling complex Rsc7/Swp82 subunit-domain-containing protein [Clohesyomyces aquaticus]
MDGSGTINPAALNSSGVLGGPQPGAPQPSRGLKRSRSPDNGYGDGQLGGHGDEDDSKPRKRGRPPKGSKVAFAESPHSAQQPPTPSQNNSAPPVQTPQLANTPLPQTSPTQASPTKSTPTKSTVIKALPTVRDHTTDQLNPEGDEYVPREYDEAGEKKVDPNGHPLDGREYRCRTFYVPKRKQKLFMLATECARVLGYRDSYLLFNKNRSLYKIIATQAEKDDLIHQEILPYSYRSRQIAIVTARSMFRQFGSRLITNGRRVRDDYWESKARKQGFTEEDAAGEKRPGAAKAREAAAAEASASAHALAFGAAGAYPGKLDHDYLGAGVNPMQPYGVLTPAPGAVPPASSDPFNHATTTDLQPRDYGNVQRPKQEFSGVPYQDPTRPSPSSEILNQAAQTAEFNKQLEVQRKNRKEYLDNYWRRPHEPPVQSPRPTTAEGENVQVSQAIQSPHLPSASAAPQAGQRGMVTHLPQAQRMPNVQQYPQQGYPQSAMVPSPRHQQQVHTPMRPDQMHQRVPSMGMPPGGAQPPPSGYGYAPSHMWPQGQPQPSPLSQQHNMQQYAPHAAQQSPHAQSSPMGVPPQLHHTQSSGSMHGTPVQRYQTMSAMPSPGYPAMGQNPYQQSPNPQHFMQQSTAVQQPGMAGWAPGAQPPPQGWQTY